VLTKKLCKVWFVIT